MRIRTLIVGYVLALALFLFAQRHPDSSVPTEFRGVLDLTHSINAQALAYDSAEIETRIDAPAHFSRSLLTVDQIPTERLLAPLVVLDVCANTANHPDYQISVEDIARWEQAHNQIPLGSVVIARTGWDSRWKSLKDYRTLTRKARCISPDFPRTRQNFWSKDAMPWASASIP